MDIPRPGVARQKRLRRVIYGAVAAFAILLITLGLSRLKPAAPTVERATVWIDQVKRGPMLRQVRLAAHFKVKHAPHERSCQD